MDKYYQGVSLKGMTPFAFFLISLFFFHALSIFKYFVESRGSYKKGTSREIFAWASFAIFYKIYACRKSVNRITRRIGFCNTGSSFVYLSNLFAVNF